MPEGLDKELTTDLIGYKLEGVIQESADRGILKTCAILGYM
jgi:hypothetical protein